MADHLVLSKVSTAIEAAWSAATWGDTITMEVGAPYVGTVDLPFKAGYAGTKIKFRSTPHASLPTAGRRFNPTLHAALTARLQPVQDSANRSEPSIDLGPSAEGIELECLQFMQSFDGSGAMVEIGGNNASFTLLAHQTNAVKIRACYFNGKSTNARQLQKRGASLHGKNIEVVDSYFVCGSPSNTGDSQCIWYYNGLGPYTFRNNHLQGGTENVLSGGDQAFIKTVGTIQASPTPTATSLRVVVTNGGDAPVVGQHIAVTSASGTWRTHPDVVTVSLVAANTYDLTFVAVDVGTKATPTAGADIRWQVTPKTVLFEENYFYKDPAERGTKILDTPGSVLATAGVGGSLAAGTYNVRVTALMGAHGTTIYSTSSTAQAVVVAASGKIDVSWTAVTGATSYRVYVQSASLLTWHYKTVTAPAVSTAYTATGTSSGSGPPSGNGWAHKCSFELKCGEDVTVRDNIFENHWPGIDIGYCLWVKVSNNSAGGYASASMTGRNWLIEGNEVRHCAGFLLCSGNENESNNNALRPRTVSGLTVRNNYVWNSGTEPWLEGNYMFAFNLANAGDDYLIDHNTVLHYRYGTATLNMSAADEIHFTNLIITNNICLESGLGWRGQSSSFSSGEGSVAFAAFTTPSTYAYTNNVLADGTAGLYPAGVGNLFPTTATLSTDYFEDYAANDHRLKTGSPALGAGTSGSNIGADVAAIRAATQFVVGGDPGAPLTPPEILTLTLPDGIEGTAYSEFINAQTEAPPLVFAVTSGALPTGLSLDAATGEVHGTLGADGTFTFDVTVTDDNLEDDVQAYTMVVAPFVPDIPTRYYFPSSGTAPIVAAHGSGWDLTTSANRYNLVTTKIGSAKVNRQQTATTNPFEYILGHQYVGPPLAAQLIDCVVTGVVMCRANQVSTNFTLALCVRVVDAAGVHKVFLTRSGAELPVASEDIVNTPPMFGANATPGRNRQFKHAAEGTTIVLNPFFCASGDRVVVEIGALNQTAIGGTHTLTLRVGDSTGVDCTFDETGSPDNDAWIEFSQEFEPYVAPEVTNDVFGSVYRWGYQSTDVST